MAEIALLFFVASVVGFFAIYWLISRETADPEVVDWETAEREAREIGGRDGSRGRRRRSSRPDARDDDEL